MVVTVWDSQEGREGSGEVAVTVWDSPRAGGYGVVRTAWDSPVKYVTDAPAQQQQVKHLRS